MKVVRSFYFRIRLLRVGKRACLISKDGSILIVSVEYVWLVPELMTDRFPPAGIT